MRHPNLRAGRLLLVWRADGIREGVERLADYVQVAPQSRFQLALWSCRSTTSTRTPSWWYRRWWVGRSRSNAPW